MHHIAIKCLGWGLSFPLALSIGDAISGLMLPSWFSWAYPFYFGGYGFLLAWLLVALFGDEDFLHWAKKQINNKVEEKTKARQQASRQNRFKAHDHSRG